MSRRAPLAVFAALFLVLFVFETPAWAAANEGDFGETNLNIHNDWIMYVDVQRKKQLFAYPGSKLRPITNLRVSYRKSKRVASDDEEAINPKLYEELWYHQGKAVGSRRFARLGIESGKKGTIYVRTTDDAQAEPQAVANAIVRLCVQLWIKDVVVTTVVVPRDMFREVATAMGELNFYSMPSDANIPGMNVSMYMVSNPGGMEAYMYYLKKR